MTTIDAHAASRLRASASSARVAVVSRSRAYTVPNGPISRASAAVKVPVPAPRSVLGKSTGNASHHHAPPSERGYRKARSGTPGGDACELQPRPSSSPLEQGHDQGEQCSACRAPCGHQKKRHTERPYRQFDVHVGALPLQEHDGRRDHEPYRRPGERRTDHTASPPKNRRHTPPHVRM